MRISTAQIFQNGLEAMQRHQTELARTEQQLASGKRILAPSDDPSGTAESLTLREHMASLDQYGRNADAGTNRLSQEESALSQMSIGLQRVRELALQGANASQTDDSRAAIAREIRQIGAGLLDTANAQDANGEYLFAGYRSTSRPFVADGTGTVAYLGDSGQRHLALSPNRSVATSDSGDAFMTIPRGNGRFLVTPSDGNTGTAAVSAAEVLDGSAIDGGSYDIVMTDATSYQVQDGGGSVVAAGSYAPGQAIDFGGRRIVLSGTPAGGDRFQVTPAGTTSLFALVDRIAGTLESGAGDAAARVRLNGELNAALDDVDQAAGRVLELRTDVGARLNTIDDQTAANADQSVQLETALSGVEDLDYADAISRFQLQQVALQAAQQTYVQMGHLSLFNYL